MSPVSEQVRPEGNFVRQFSVFLNNRAGTFSALVSLLSAEKINILGLSVQDSRDTAVARMVFDDPERAREIFLEKGIPHTICELVVVCLKQPESDLQNCLSVLTGAETNVDFAYALIPRIDGCSLLAFHLEDSCFGARVLHRAGHRVVYEEDVRR